MCAVWNGHPPIAVLVYRALSMGTVCYHLPIIYLFSDCVPRKIDACIFNTHMLSYYKVLGCNRTLNLFKPCSNSCSLLYCRACVCMRAGNLIVVTIEYEGGFFNRYGVTV